MKVLLEMLKEPAKQPEYKYIPKEKVLDDIIEIKIDLPEE